MSELGWFILALIILWVLWVLSGGPTHQESRTRQFIEQPAPIESGRIYSLDELKDRTRP